MTLKNLINFVTENWVILAQLYSAILFGFSFAMIIRSTDQEEKLELWTGIVILFTGNFVAAMAMAKPWEMVSGLSVQWYGVAIGHTILATLGSAQDQIRAFVMGLSPQAILGFVIFYAEGLCLMALSEREFLEKIREKQGRKSLPGVYHR